MGKLPKKYNWQRMIISPHRRPFSPIFMVILSAVRVVIAGLTTVYKLQPISYEFLSTAVLTNLDKSPYME